MGRPSKKAKTIRRATEFDLSRLLRRLSPPLASQQVYAWQLEDIRAARDEQMRGQFKRPAQLAASMRTDDAIFTARRTRLEPLRSLSVALAAASGSTRAENIAKEAEALYGARGIALTTETLASIHGDIVDHGVGFATIDARPRDDGSRVDLFVSHWPIEWVKFDSSLRCYTTQVEQSDDGAPAFQVPIIHGDGRWLVFQKVDTEAWRNEACVLPAALVWAARAFGLRDWGKNSSAHGSAKMFGELPEGVALVDADNNPTPEAAAFLAVLEEVMSGSSLVGLRPAGAKTEFVANASTNWQIFSELITGREKAAARIYLGTDGTLGSVGGAPGVDISALFGIATTLMQGDADCIEQGLHTGLLPVWTAINFGDSSLSPLREYQLPDPDAARSHEEAAKRDEQFHAEIDRLAKRFELTQEVVDAVAKRYGVTAPKLKVAPTTTQPAASPIPTNGASKPAANGAVAA